MKILTKSLSVFLAVLVFVTPLHAETVVRQYEVPDVKNDFCGVHINFQWCKCAFHNEYCKAVSSEPGLAHTYVYNQFLDWNGERIQAMGEQCIENNGSWDRNDWECTYDVVDPELLECQAALKNFDTEWEKYSDFDDRLGSDVSYEVSKFNETLDDIGHLIAEAHEIEYQMGLEVEIRNEIKAYKNALVLNIQQNITKAIFRLAWVTYNTTKSAYGAKGSVEKLLDPANHIESAGATLKIIQGHIPPHAKNLQFNTASTSGKVASIIWNASLEAMESTANPYELAKQGMKDVKSVSIPGPDISAEEVAILRDQHLTKEATNTAIADSYTASAKLRDELAAQKKLISEQYNELEKLKLAEYKRVKLGLEEQCKALAEK